MNQKQCRYPTAVLIVTMMAIMGCGPAKRSSEALDDVMVDLISARAGGKGGHCPDSYVQIAIDVKNHGDTAAAIQLVRVQVLGESGRPLHGSASVLSAKELTLQVDGKPFSGDVPAQSTMRIVAEGSFLSTTYLDNGTWHTDVELSIDGQALRLVGTPETGMWPHTECGLMCGGSAAITCCGQCGDTCGGTLWPARCENDRWVCPKGALEESKWQDEWDSGACAP
jgi:hypothetical protein